MNITPKLSAQLFDTLVRTLQSQVDLLGAGQRLAPWKKATHRAVLKAVTPATDHLPLLYQQNYVTPLLNTLKSVIARSSARTHSRQQKEDVRDNFERTIEILAGAIYCHSSRTIPANVGMAIRCFLAVVSNTHRSFVPTSGRYRDWVPSQPKELYPPLATFRNGEKAPYMMSSEEITRLTGGKVGVVVLPVTYKDHPLLWTAIAHEVGGHELLNAMPNLLMELQRGVHQLFNVRSVQSGKYLDTEQLIGLLWQYWTEETVADVCGVLNIGPTYGLSLAVYQAALYRSYAEASDTETDAFLRLWGGEPEYRARWLDNSDILPELDPHPIDILKLHVIIGAVESLSSLSQEARRYYVDQLEQLAHICAGDATELGVCGLVQTGPDQWIRVNTYMEKHLPLGQMQEAARRVGAFIAKVQLQALEGHSLQQLETWDDTDEEHAQAVAASLANAKQADTIGELGDDAQLLAGATLAFAENPKSYGLQTKALLKALEDSYARDFYWGVSKLHFLHQYGPEGEESYLIGDILAALHKRKDPGLVGNKTMASPAIRKGRRAPVKEAVP